MQQSKFIDKYAPQKISDMVLSGDLKQYFQNMVSSGKYVNCSLIAGPGIGKTTLARTLAKEANAEVLFLSCASGDGKVEAIQTKLVPFAQSLPMEDRPMFVILDELDSASATQDSSFQKALRNVIEQFPTVTFIATANYGQKIIPAILSRCPQVNLKFTPKDVLLRIKKILDEERINYTKADLEKFIKVVLKKHYPDIRTVLNLLQGCCFSGTFQFSKDAVSDHGSEDFVRELVSFVFEHSDNVLGIRKFYLQSKTKISDYEVLAGNVFNHVMDMDTIQFDKNTISKLADIIYQMGMVVDKEISFFQFLVVLSGLKQKIING